MPRRARVIVPGMPHHIVQRGHNKKAVFVEGGDYQYYLDNLVEWKNELGLALYSYCLMTNHIHLIVKANDSVGSIGELMKRLAGRQTRYVNKKENRTGSLWESRYKISPIQTDSYLLQCCRYVELNPVKALMVDKPEIYRWSSYAIKIGLIENTSLDLDPCYLSLAQTEISRRENYKSYVEAGTSFEEQKFIQNAVERNQLTGNYKFTDEIESRLGVRVEYRGRGRPSRSKLGAVK